MKFHEFNAPRLSNSEGTIAERPHRRNLRNLFVFRSVRTHRKILRLELLRFVGREKALLGVDLDIAVRKPFLVRYDANLHRMDKGKYLFLRNLPRNPPHLLTHYLHGVRVAVLEEELQYLELQDSAKDKFCDIYMILDI